MKVSKALLYILLAGTIGLYLGMSPHVRAEQEPIKVEEEQGAPPVSKQAVPNSEHVKKLYGCPPQTSGVYALGAEDVIAVRIYNEGDLSGLYKVNNAGVISMPLIGDVLVSGCSLEETKSLIYQKYTDGYLINPSITIEVSSYRPFYIIGEVGVPGKYDYSVGMNVLQAVAIAGGFTYRANRKAARILRKNEQGVDTYEIKKIEAEVQPGDVILIKERFF